MVLGANVGILLVVTLGIVNAPILLLYFFLHEFGQKGLYDTAYYLK